MQDLSSEKHIFIRQRRELAELVGFETRNKYEIDDSNGNPLGFAAEQGKSGLSMILRHFLGHWRSFEVLVFDTNRQVELRLVHPFRFFFQRLEVFDRQQKNIGVIQQRFSIFRKSFDFLNERGAVLFRVRSPFWRFWTFKVQKDLREIARIEKKWSGILKEGFTDQDNFRVNFVDPNTDQSTRQLILAAAIFIDLQYFEKRAGS